MVNQVITGHFASILHALTDAVFCIAADGEVVWLSTVAERMFGWASDEIVGRNIDVIVPFPYKEKHDGYLASFNPARGITHVLGVGQRLEAERRDGSHFPVEVGISPLEIDGRRFFIGFVRDVSERRAAEEKLHFLATHDQITGLPNGHMLLEMTGQALAAGRVSMIALTLVGLVRVRDRHGQRAAEQVLRTMAQRLRGHLRDDALLARVDGDILAVMVAGPVSAEEAGKLHQAVAEPVPWGSVTLHLTAAVGLAEATPGETAAEDLLRSALAASGQVTARQICGGVAVFDRDLGTRIARETRMEERLRAAIREEALSLALQAKVCSRTGTVMGAEALARWTDPELGGISPGEFIPLAERTGLIGDLDAWMLRRSLEEAAEWQRRGLDLSVAVNLSAVELRQSNLVDNVADAIARSGCDPRRLVLELTESALADDADLAVAQLTGLKRLGISLSLDDFGTGYSSLSYLRQFPIDTLKIDRSFVIDLPHDKDAQAIARTIVSLARSLSMESLAEGVETPEQADFLRTAGVQVFQGFLYSRPISPERFVGLVEKGPLVS